MKVNEPQSNSTSLRVIVERPPRVFAIGDLHGCYEETKALIDYLKEHEALSAEDLCIFIGDYIDRGARSKEIIDLMLQVRAEWPRTVFIKGNHEDMLLDYLGYGGESGDVYLENGGFEFLKSYGLHPFTPRDDVIAALPPPHLEFLRGLELGVVLAEFVFVHAGINPTRGLDSQQSHDLMWIRGDFVHAEHTAGKTVVFGHTPFEDIFIHLPYKIGIDTGLVYGNRLSAVELVHGKLFQIERGESVVSTYNLRDRLGG